MPASFPQPSLGRFPKVSVTQCWLSWLWQKTWSTFCPDASSEFLTSAGPYVSVEDQYRRDEAKARAASIHTRAFHPSARSSVKATHEAGIQLYASAKSGGYVLPNDLPESAHKCAPPPSTHRSHTRTGVAPRLWTCAAPRLTCAPARSHRYNHFYNTHMHHFRHTKAPKSLYM